MIKHAAEKFNSSPYLNSSLRINLALMPMKEILECYPAHELSRIPELRPEPELGQSSCNNNKNKQKP